MQRRERRPLVDVGFPDLEFWTDLLRRLGLSNGQLQAHQAANGGGVTYRNNCNGGLYVGGRGYWARIAPEWRRAADALPTWTMVPQLEPRLRPDRVRCRLRPARPRRRPASATPDLPFHVSPPRPLDIQPVLLHHHQSLESGRLHCRPEHTTCPGVLTAARRVNRVPDRLDWKAFGLYAPKPPVTVATAFLTGATRSRRPSGRSPPRFRQGPRPSSSTRT